MTPLMIKMINNKNIRTIICPWCKNVVALDQNDCMIQHKSGATALNRTSRPWKILRQRCAYSGVTLSEALDGITQFSKQRHKHSKFNKGGD